MGTLSCCPRVCLLAALWQSRCCFAKLGLKFTRSQGKEPLLTPAGTTSPKPCQAGGPACVCCPAAAAAAAAQKPSALCHKFRFGPAAAVAVLLLRVLQLAAGFCFAPAQVASAEGCPQRFQRAVGPCTQCSKLALRSPASVLRRFSMTWALGMNQLLRLKRMLWSFWPCTSTASASARAWIPRRRRLGTTSSLWLLLRSCQPGALMLQGVPKHQMVKRTAWRRSG